MGKLVLIDGHAILHRAYHALPPKFTNKEGQATNAVYGFSTMMLRVLADLKPEYLAVAFDLPAPTFRQQLYTAYQAKRPEMDGNLKDQVTLVHEMLSALKIPYFEVAGFEADDCIGTLAAQAVNGSSFMVHSQEKRSTINDERSTMNLELYIVTGDRDMLQLVNSHVKVYVPIKGLTETKTYDERLVEDEFGVKPSQWVDVKALKGDASDNYPGVAGIGPKTACELIAKYSTLENLYQHLGKLPEKVAMKLAEGTEAAGLGKKLAQITTDVPIHLDLSLAEVAKINWEEGIKYMREILGFKSIPERIEKDILNRVSNTVTKLPSKNEGPDFAKASPGKQMKLI